MQEQMQDQEQPVLNPVYWNQAAFHQALQTVPFRQHDAAGHLVVNVHDHFFKLDAGALRMARVPQSLAIPSEWSDMPADHPLRTKVMSMLGLEAGQ